MPITAQLDAYGKPAWIALIVLGFMVWWPLGLGALAFTIGSGRMGCGQHHWQNKIERMQNKMDWMRSRMGGNPWGFYAPSSGNRAFDDYRAETLRRLEDEQREFREFLARLRLAKDKTEFDQFMAERRNRPDGNPPQG
ncbi:MAG TPA: DUF2852 domain-containing protein [Pseudolabrys sp.]|jgi:hypothetical protein|nr:DUF2852 domain-containing protein [Pseudolabrys sp.]